MSIVFYIVRRGNKYLHINQDDGVYWGRKADAFHFYSAEAAAQIACALSTPKATISIEMSEEV